MTTMPVPSMLGTSPMPSRQYAAATGQHVSLGAPLRAMLFIVLFVPLLLLLIALRVSGGLTVGTLVVWGVLVGTFVSGVRVAAQWERGVLLRLGRFNGIRGPGMFYAIPFLDYVRFVDTRVLALNIPRQQVITKDNVPAQIDGVLFFRVTDAERAITAIQDYKFAIAQYAQASLRDVVGGMSLDDLLVEREQIQVQIGQVVEAHVKDWGVHIDSIRLLDIEMPEDLKRMMSRQASAEREKRATITKAEGDKLAADNLAAAATTMAASPGAMQLRMLQTVDGLGPSPSNTVVLFPIELSDALKSVAQFMDKKPEDKQPAPPA
jgi:regulator of protease activity HflC (stomatin/prohibitin superfamily)